MPTLRCIVSCLVIVLARGAAGQVAMPAAEAESGAAVGTADAAVEEAPRIDASEAADHVGEECVVEMVVEAGRLLDDKHMCFLNTRKDRRAADNFTVVIFRRGLERFREADIEDPASHFLDRTIRVRGTVAEHKGQPQIVVEDPEQVELVEEPVAAAADSD
ncbi:MAG: hypothetical protein ACKON7_12190 [Planctomycetaceae bacterium]